MYALNLIVIVIWKKKKKKKKKKNSIEIDGYILYKLIIIIYWILKKKKCIKLLWLYIWNVNNIYIKCMKLIL